MRWPSEGARNRGSPTPPPPSNGSGRLVRRCRLGRHHPFTYGRWDAAAQAHQSKEDSRRNNDAVTFYYADGALDPVATRKAVAEFGTPVLLLADEDDVGLPLRNAAECAGLFEYAELAVRCGPAPGTSPARRSRVVHADTGGLSRLTASSSSVAATVAPSVRIAQATAVARARVSGVRAVLSAADRDSVVGVGPSCAVPMPRSATRPAKYGWSAPWGTTT